MRSFLLLASLITGLNLSYLKAQDLHKDSCVQLTTNISDWIVENKYDSVTAYFDSTMNRAISASILSDIWESQLIRYGNLLKRGPVATESKSPFIIGTQSFIFEKGHFQIRITINAEMKVSGLFIKPMGNQYEVPDYVNNMKFIEHKITFGNDEFHLDGMLSIGREKKRYPLLIILQGSGPQDMDGTIEMNKIYKDMAWGIATHGIAVFRYPKRTSIYGAHYLNGKPDQPYTLQDEYIDDILNAIQALKKRDDIDSNSIYLLGHSQGGDAAILAAHQSGKVKGIIMASTSPRKLQDIMCEQLDYIYGYEPVGSYRNVMAQKLKSKLVYSMRDDVSLLDPLDSFPMNIAPSYWMYLNHLNLIDTLKTMPQLDVLFLQGGRDYQITTVDFGEWKKAFGDRPKTEFRMYPFLNHMYFSGYGRSTAVEYEERHHVDETIIRDICDWIKK